MQYPNTSQSSNPALFPPKVNPLFSQFPGMNPFFQMFSSMPPFQNFGFPSGPDFVQMKFLQSMFEKFLQFQMQKNTNGFGFNSGLENPFLMNMFNETYLKALKGQNPKPNVNGVSSDVQEQEAKAQMAIKEEFIAQQTSIPANIESSQTMNNISPSVTAPKNISPNLNLKVGSAEEEAKKPEGVLSPEAAIKEMLLYFVKHIGTIRRTLIEKDGEAIHHNNEDLKEIFIGLMKKFLSSRKTKEEKIKYVLRKCFKFMKDKLLEENGFTFDSTDDYVEKLNSDKVDKMFFKHYFSEKCGKQKKFLTKNEITFIKDISMPFRKNSQNKTMNIDFLRWIFSNDAFFLDYKLFLKSFNDVTNQDNIEKIAKTAKKIFELMETKNYKAFSQKYFKRMPWLDIWRIEAKEIALSLIDVYAKPEEKGEMLDSEEISLENLEPVMKKIKVDVPENETQNLATN